MPERHADANGALMHLAVSGDAVGFRHLLCGVTHPQAVEYSATAGGTGIKSRKRKRERVSGAVS